MLRLSWSLRLLALLVFLGLAPGCSSQGTQLLVVVDTDYAVRSEVTTVRVTVEGAGVRDTRSFELAERGGPPSARYLALPLSFAVVPKGGDASRQVTVTAEALDERGTTRVSTFARTGFVEGQARVLELFLAQRCVMADCGPGQTCSRDGCISATRPADSLPALPPGAMPLTDGSLPRGDGSGDRADGLADGASDIVGMDAPRDAPDSALDAPQDLGMDLGIDSGRMDGPPPADTIVRVDVVTGEGIGPADVASACPAGFEDCNLLPEDGCETNVQTNPMACGSCGIVCPREQLCVLGRCTAATPCAAMSMRCLRGAVLETCAGGSWSDSDCRPGKPCRFARCGCTPGATECASVTEERYCDPTTRTRITRTCPTGSQCDPAQRRCIVSPLPDMVYYPRLVAPLSGSVLSTRRPILRWEIALRSMQTLVEVCLDPGCVQVVDVIDTQGTRVRLEHLAMPSGRLRTTFFWRARAHRGPQFFPHTPVWRFTVDDRAPGLGTAARLGAVDIDNDGVGDMVVGTGPDTETQRRVDIYRGGATLPTMATQTLTMGPGSIGHAVAATDMNGDGTDDVIVASSTPGVGYTISFHPSTLTAGVLSPPSVTAGLPFAAVGLQLARAGDVNGDGYGDVLVGLPDASSGAGGAWLLLGSSGGMRTTPAPVGGSAFISPAGARFGASVAGIGDLDGDGLWEVAIGAPGARSIFLFRGPADVPTLNVAVPGSSPNFGATLSPAGDMNNDGYPDLAVGSLGTDLINSVRILYGAPSFLTPPTLATVPIPAPSGPALTALGRGLAGGGDLNGDGLDDFVVSALQLNINDLFSVLGNTTPGRSVALPAIPILGVLSGQAMASLGDLNGDGLADLVVQEHASPMPSRVLVFRGDNRGLESAPIVTWAPPAGVVRWGGALPH
jgi:hypothetical protein